MKAIYYNIFGLSHINPTLPLVKALVNRDVEVIYQTGPEKKILPILSSQEISLNIKQMKDHLESHKEVSGIISFTEGRI